jgi:hypothetical protein
MSTGAMPDPSTGSRNYLADDFNAIRAVISIMTQVENLAALRCCRPGLHSPVAVSGSRQLYDPRFRPHDAVALKQLAFSHNAAVDRKEKSNGSSR